MLLKGSPARGLEILCHKANVGDIMFQLPESTRYSLIGSTYQILIVFPTPSMLVRTIYHSCRVICVHMPRVDSPNVDPTGDHICSISRIIDASAKTGSLKKS